MRHLLFLHLLVSSNPFRYSFFTYTKFLLIAFTLFSIRCTKHHSPLSSPCHAKSFSAYLKLEFSTPRLRQKILNSSRLAHTFLRRSTTFTPSTETVMSTGRFFMPRALNSYCKQNRLFDKNWIFCSKLTDFFYLYSIKNLRK